MSHYFISNRLAAIFLSVHECNNEKFSADETGVNFIFIYPPMRHSYILLWLSVYLYLVSCRKLLIHWEWVMYLCVTFDDFSVILSILLFMRKPLPFLWAIEVCCNLLPRPTRKHIHSTKDCMLVKYIVKVWWPHKYHL